MQVESKSRATEYFEKWLIIVFRCYERNWESQVQKGDQGSEITVSSLCPEMPAILVAEQELTRGFWEATCSQLLEWNHWRKLVGKGMEGWPYLASGASCWDKLMWEQRRARICGNLRTAVPLSVTTWIKSWILQNSCEFFSESSRNTGKTLGKVVPAWWS